MSGKYDIGDKFVIEITMKHPSDIGISQYYTTNNGLSLPEVFFDKAELIEEDPTCEADWWSDGYNSGLVDAWAAARKMVNSKENGGLGYEGMKDTFGTGAFTIAFNTHIASEAISKIREYEEKKKAEEIKIGDEIVNGNGDIYVVVRICNNDNTLDILNSNGVDFGIDPTKFKKTGRHFPQIAEVLEAMKTDDADTD